MPKRKLSPAERIALQTDIWASVRVGREPVGDYLALAQGLAGIAIAPCSKMFSIGSTTLANIW